MRPDVDVPLRPLLGRSHVNETSGREINPGDEGRRSRARFDRLSFFAPVTDASAKQFGDAATLSLVPAQARLEVAFTSTLVLEQAVERQDGAGTGTTIVT